MTENNPIPPSPDPVPPAAPGVTTPATGFTTPPPPVLPDDKNMGMLCHLLGIFTGFLGPLIIWLMKKEQSAYVDDQGKEALNFQIAAMIATIACFLGFCLAPVLITIVQITRIVFSIIATVQTNKGVGYRYPVTFRFIK